MNGKRGSALLIVLGFLSFMVVSAVAFSIYMRSERVPSSVFRKNVAIRHLVQAGLSQAMSELDDAIRDDPFPGVIKNPGNNVKFMPQANVNVPVNPPYAGLDSNRRYIDWWLGRVFMPPNPDDERDGSVMAPEGQTVAVANIEGLGYVPPPLINDVRFLSRRTWSAKWRNFDYGVGRFAYCAVNVSDYFDINRMSVAESRSGFRRVSLAPLFRSGSDPNRLNVDFGKANRFRDFVGSPGSDSEGAQNSWKLVSMLDYALANESGNCGFQSYPFYDWVKNSTRQMYRGQENDDAQYQTFVTDSWFPASYKEQAKPTLALDATGRMRGQPFDLDVYNDMAMTPQPLDVILTSDFPDATGEGGVRFEDMLSGTELVALWDYIDRDDIPTSLALPTVERNPMIVAISPQAAGLNLTVPATPLTAATASSTAPVTTMVNFDLTGFNDIANSGLNVVLAYPFKHSRLNGVDLARGNYQVQAVAKIFFVEKSTVVGTRGKAFAASSYANAVFRPSDSDYTGSSGVANNVITLVSRPGTTVSFSGKDDIAVDVPVMFQPLSGNIPVVEHVSTWVSTGPAPAPGVAAPGNAVSTWNIQFFPIDLEGNAVTPNGYTAGAASLPVDEYVPVMAVWVRVKDVSRNFVADCVPATFFEDTFNNITRNQTMKSALSLQFACGDKEPLLRFTCDASSVPTFKYEGVHGTGATGPFTSTVNYPVGMQPWQQKGIWAVDPRYNHAPEDWCMDTGSDIGWQDWENRANSASGQTGCDGDPYVFVSNQGFLQSMGELAFLPRVKEKFSVRYQPDMWGSRWKNLRGNDYLTGINQYSTAPGGGLADMVWRTYEPWDNTTSGDNLFGCGIAEHTGGGFVNPYSDSIEVFTAALANTPVNWWAAASTNTVKDASRGQKDDDKVAVRRTNFTDLRSSLEFAFNEEGSAASEDRELKYEALKKMANGMKQAFREGVLQNKDWKEIYDDWDWTPTGTPFSWADDSNFTDQLDSIDCRYLYSFWRGCFANRQQLFLVFVRAESMALGGSGEGQIPPQQGGRAVALVWRDPETPKISNDLNMANGRKPHRMRVLFYHQLD
jgi:hypothetical protein